MGEDAHRGGAWPAAAPLPEGCALAAVLAGGRPGSSSSPAREGCWQHVSLRCARQLRRLLRGACGRSELRRRAPAAAPAVRRKAAALRARCSGRTAVPWWVLLLLPVVSSQLADGQSGCRSGRASSLAADTRHRTRLLQHTRARTAYSHARKCLRWPLAYVPRVCPADASGGSVRLHMSNP